MENTPITTLSHKEVIVQPTSRENSDVADLINDADEEINWVTARDRQTYKHKKIMTTESSSSAAAEMKPKPPWVFYMVMVLKAIIHNITKIKNINHNITNTHLAMYKTRIHEFLAILYTSCYKSGTEPLFISKTHHSLQWLQHKYYEYTHVISCMFGGKRLLYMAYVRLKQFIRELSTSLEWQVGQYGGICTIFNPVNNQWEIFWIKYHPLQQEYIINAYEFPALNEVEIFLSIVIIIVYCLQRAVITVINFVVIGNNSFDFNILQILNIIHYTLLRSCGSVGEDTALHDVRDPTPCVVQQALEYRAFFYAGGLRQDSPLFFRRATTTTYDVPLTNEVATNDAPDTIVCQATAECAFEDDAVSLSGHHETLPSPVLKNILVTKCKFLGKDYFNELIGRMYNPNMEEIRKWYYRERDNGQLTKAGWLLDKLLKRNESSENVSNCNIEHKFPFAFAVIVLNILNNIGELSVQLVDDVFNVLNSPENLEVMNSAANTDLGKISENVLKKIQNKFNSKWKRNKIDNYLDTINFLFNQLILESDPGSLDYFRRNLVNIYHLIPSPEFQRIAMHIFLLPQVSDPTVPSEWPDIVRLYKNISEKQTQSRFYVVNFVCLGRSLAFVINCFIFIRNLRIEMCFVVMIYIVYFTYCCV